MVEFLEETNKSSLSDEQIEKLCILADEAARKYIVSKISNREIDDLSISVDLEESKSLKVEVEVDLTLSQSCRDVDAEKIADDAVKMAFKAIDEYLREVKCQSKI
jgi:hypothetical protein